jgi:hypothetical protein
MDAVVRIGAIARLEPDPGAEVAVWEADLAVGLIDDPSETRARLDALQRGDQMIVRLEVFAEVRRGDDLARFNGEHVEGVWFEVGAETANRAHAREMVSSHLDRLYEKLIVDHGVEVDYRELLDAPVTIEYEDALARRVTGA